MFGFLSRYRYDAAFLAASLLLLGFVQVFLQSHLARVAAWFTIFTMYVCWMGYAAYRWTWDEETPA